MSRNFVATNRLESRAANIYRVSPKSTAFSDFQWCCAMISCGFHSSTYFRSVILGSNVSEEESHEGDANLSPLSSFILTWKGEPKNSWRASLMLHLPEWPHIPSPAHPPCISWSKFRRPVTTFIKEILDKPIGADHFCFLQWAILPWLDYLLFWALVWFKMYYQSIIFTKKYKKESPSASALQHHLKEFLIARGGRAPIIWI